MTKYKDKVDRMNISLMDFFDQMNNPVFHKTKIDKAFYVFFFCKPELPFNTFWVVFLFLLAP